MMTPQFDLKEVIPALSLIIDHQASGNLYHGFRVAIIAHGLGEKIMPSEEDSLFYQGLLHDVGLFETGEHIIPNYMDLNSQKTRKIFLDHPSLSASIVEAIPGMQKASLPIKEHHEYFDGSGYPFGKKSNEISRQGQILRAADSFDFFLRRHPNLTLQDIDKFVEQKKNKEFSEEMAFSFLQLDKEMLLHISEEEGLKSYYSILNNEICFPHVAITGNVEESVLKIFSRAIDGKHHYTKEHSLRVSRLSFEIARKMDIPEHSCEKIKYAGYLHDIGKIAIPNRILDKPGALNEEEWRVIKTHAAISYDIVNIVSYFKDFAELVFASQEEYDGTGYPRGLRGEDIPYGARIISVADAIDAMLSDRAYRKALPREIALAEITRNAGSQFDPEAVKAATTLI